MSDSIGALARRVLDGGQLARSELLALCQLDQAQTPEILHWAWKVRVSHFGGKVRLCSISSGRTDACSEDCAWCAQSSHHHCKPKPSVQTQKIAQRYHRANGLGVGCFGIVNSGRGPSEKELDGVISTIQKLKSGKGGETGICTSLGVIKPADAKKLSQCGISRYHHNLETSRSFFAKMVSTHTWDERLETLLAARDAGLRICSGGIFGLGETWEDRLDLALTLREKVKPDSVPLNFLHPIPGTPLENTKPPSPMECLKIIAIFRLAMPTTDILIGGGRTHNLKNLQSWIFHAGATAMLTGDYLTTAGGKIEDDLGMIQQLNLTLVDEFYT